MADEEQRLRDAHAVGIFGGTFDPVHYGHLLLAECALEALDLDLILFMPANIPPHKMNGRTITPAGCRLEMLRLAVEPNSRFAISSHEIDGQGVSYTVDTLAWLRERFAPLALTLLIGGDSARDFRTWRSPEQIVEMAKVAVIERPGVDLPGELLPGLGYRRVEAPLMELSSTAIRGRVAHGHSIRYRTPDIVIQYIETNALYR